MSHLWNIEYETPSGRTDNAAATFLTLLTWMEFTITFRQRSVGNITITIPQDGAHHLTDFVSGRELRITRNGVYWWAGFINAAYLPNGDGPGPIVLDGWNNAYALMLIRNSTLVGFTGINYYGSGYDADAIINSVLDAAEHYAGTNWFPAAQRTIGAAAAGVLQYITSGKSALEEINELCDVEGWSWRVGINSSGTFTFKAGSSAIQDLTASLHVYTPTAQTRITNHRRDGRSITSLVKVVQRTPRLATQLNGAFAAGSTNLTVDSTARMEAGDILVFSEGVPTLQEQKVISTVNTATTLTLTAGLTNNQPDNANIRTVVDNRARFVTVTAAAAVEQAHHKQQWVIWDDKLDGATRRTQIGTAYIDAYDHPLETASISTTDTILIDQMIEAAMEPGDSIKITSDHPELSTVYNNTTVVVREMSITVRSDAGPTLTAQLGDPQLDALDEITRRFASAQAAATSVGA